MSTSTLFCLPFFLLVSLLISSILILRNIYLYHNVNQHLLLNNTQLAWVRVEWSIFKILVGRSMISNTSLYFLSNTPPPNNLSQRPYQSHSCSDIKYFSSDCLYITNMMYSRFSSIYHSCVSRKKSILLSVCQYYSYKTSAGVLHAPGWTWTET